MLVPSTLGSTIKTIQAKQMTESILSIGLSNPKSPVNVGLVMRAAGCFQVDSVVFIPTIGSLNLAAAVNVML